MSKNYGVWVNEENKVWVEVTKIEEMAEFEMELIEYKVIGSGVVGSMNADTFYSTFKLV